MCDMDHTLIRNIIWQPCN